jgi:hypothetical protein
LTDMQESSANMVANWRELSQLYNTQAQQLRALAKYFGEEGASRCAEDATATEENVRVVSELATQLDHSYLDNLNDYLREIASIEAVLARRLVFVKEYNSLAKNAEKKGVEAVAKRDEALAKLDTFSNAARADIQRILDIRKGELERIIEGFAQVHRDCFTQTASSWTTALNAPVSAEAAHHDDVEENPFADSAATTSTTTATAVAADMNDTGDEPEHVEPFSSAVVGDVPTSPYAIDD